MKDIINLLKQFYHKIWSDAENTSTRQRDSLENERELRLPLHIKLCVKGTKYNFKWYATVVLESTQRFEGDTSWENTNNFDIVKDISKGKEENIFSKKVLKIKHILVFEYLPEGHLFLAH